MLALGQLDDELLDESGDVVVRHHLALPLLDAEHRCGHFDLHVLLDLDLTAQTPVVEYLTTVEEARLGRKDRAAALDDLTLALSAGTLAAACRRQEYALLAQRIEQRRAGSDLQYLVAVVDVDLHRAGRSQFCLCKEQQQHQNERYGQKGNDCN